MYQGLESRNDTHPSMDNSFFPDLLSSTFMMSSYFSCEDRNSGTFSSHSTCMLSGHPECWGRVEVLSQSFQHGTTPSSRRYFSAALQLYPPNNRSGRLYCLPSFQYTLHILFLTINDTSWAQLHLNCLFYIVKLLVYDTTNLHSRCVPLE